MKITFKDLKQQKFVIEAEPSDLVSSLKKKIHEDRGWEPALQKLIYSGKILKDEETIESYKIEEKGFVVCVVNKPKPAPAPAAQTSNVPATPASGSSSTPAPPAAPAHSNTAASAAPSTPTPARTANVEAAAPAAPRDATAMTMGAERAEAISNMQAMGFELSQINLAMRAAFNNPERAIEYLLNGIPDNVQAEAAQPAQGGAQAAAQPAAADASAAAGGDDGNVNLFDLAAQQGRQGGSGAGGRGASLGQAAAALAAGGNQLGNLDFLRHNAQFQQLRQLVQEQPQMLEPILQQLGAGNPQLAQLISQHPEQFLQLLGESAGEDDAPLPPGAQAITVTEEERDAIERLCRLGFDRDQAIVAYFACDKNEELAANYLFDQPDEDEPGSQ